MPSPVIDLHPHELADWLADASRQQPLLLDVREEWEFEHCHIAGARHVPMALVAAKLAELAEAPGVVCICHHGIRSMQVATYLARLDEFQVFNLRGGVEAWALEVDATMPRY